MHPETNLAVFDSFPLLETRRLILRDIRPEDAPAIFGMRSDKRVNQFISRPEMTQDTAAQDLVERTRKAYENKMAIGWAGALKDGSEIIGTCGFNSIDIPNRHAEIGGEMAVRHWGTFLAQEAVIAILEFGLNTMNLHTIEAKVSPGNRSAIAVLEQMGFVREALYRDRIYFNGTFLDMAVYTLHKGNEQLSDRRTL